MPSVSEIEQLLHALKGVVSARAVMATDGRAVEIHVLATSELHPKQIVRNVESALTAGLDLEIDRRIVSVSQLQEGVDPEASETSSSGDDAGSAGSVGPAKTAGPPSSRALGSAGASADSEPGVEQPEDAPRGAPSALQTQSNGSSRKAAPSKKSADRPLLLEIRTTSGSKMENTCEVRLRVNGQEVSGAGDGLDTGSGRIDAAARATLEALQKAYPRVNVVLEGVSITTAHGQEYVLVTTHGLEGRQSTPLTGAAPLGPSPEESAVLACLQAVNRWLGRTNPQPPRK